MHFVKEIGVILDNQKNIIHLVRGTGGSVSFPEELVWKMHKLNPGSIYAFSHLHPPGMTNLSSLDKEMLKGWAYALFPFPARIITLSEDTQHKFIFYENCYLGIFDSQMKNFRIIHEYEHGQEDEYDYAGYGKILIEEGYAAK